MRFSPYSVLLVAAMSLVIGFVAGRVSFRQQPVTESDRASVSSQHVDASVEPNLVEQVALGSSLSEFSTSGFEQTARAELAKNPADQNPAILQLALTEWSKQDPEAALAFAEEQGREDWMFYCLSICGRTNPDLALAWIARHTTDLRLQNYLTTGVYQGLAKADSSAALARVDTLPQGPQRDRILYTVVGQWAERDIHSVFDWIEAQELSPLLAGIYGQTMNRYITQAPEEAIIVISAMYDNVDKRNFANQAAFELAKEDPEGALTWADTLEGEHRHAARMGLMERWGQADNSLEALQYVSELAMDSEGEDLFSMVAMKMSQSYPDSLARELPSLSEAQQEIAAIQLAQAYSALTPAQVTPWLNSIALPAVRDAAVTTALNTFRQTNIKQAFELSLTIDDHNTRRNETQQTLLEWIPVDPESAMAALLASSLPEESKRAMAANIAAQSPAMKDFVLPRVAE